MLIKRLFNSVFGCRAYKPSQDDKIQKLQQPQSISKRPRKVVTFSTNDDQSRQKQSPFSWWSKGADQQFEQDLQQCQSEVNDLEDEYDQNRLNDNSQMSAEELDRVSQQQSDSQDSDGQDSIDSGRNRGQMILRESSSFADDLNEDDNDDSEVDSQKQDSLEYSSQQQSGDDSSESEAQNCGQKETIRNGSSIKTKRQKKLQSKISSKAAAQASYNKPAKQTKKLFEDAVSSMRTLKRSLDQSFKSVDELNCPICMDYIVSCRTAICGHSFCETCINESLIHRKECPNCRKDIRKWVLQKSDIIDGAVKHMVRSAADAGDGGELTRYDERVQAHKTWLDKQEIQEVKPGEKVDALDTEYIWCKALVELKIRAKGRQPLLYLHYDGWSRKYDEYVYMDSRRIAPVGHFTGRNDIPRYASNGASRQPMNYAHVIDSARNMQNADQIENAEDQQNEGNDPAAQINAISEEVEGENENSFESLNRGLQAAEEPDPERLQDASSQRPRRVGPGLSTTSLNRDSHVGRSQEADAPATSNSVSTSSRLQRFRPQTRSHRAHQSVFHSHRRQNNPFSAALYFQSQLSRDGSGRPVPSSTRRQTASQEPTTAPNLATRTPNSGLNRSVFQFGSTTQAARGASQQQTNSGDAQGASNGNSTSRSIFDAPAPLYTQVRGRRSSVPSNNTGNIMRGSSQSNAFGGGAPTTNPFLASNTSNQNRLSLASRYETSLPAQHTACTHRPPRFPAVGANTTTQTTTTGLEQPQRITVNFGDRPSTTEGATQVRSSPFTSSQRRSPFSPGTRVSTATQGNNVALETCPIPPPSFGLLQDSQRLPSIELPQSILNAASTSQAPTTNQNNDNNQEQQQTVEPEAQHQNATSPQQQANPEDNSDSNNWVISPPPAGQPDRVRNQLSVPVSSFQDQDAAQDGGVVANNNNEGGNSDSVQADAQGANSASQQDQQQPTQPVQLVQQQSNQSQSQGQQAGDTESKRQNKE